MKKNVALFIFDVVEVLDFAGPFEVFAAADELRGGGVFNVFTFAQGPGTVRANHGLKIVPDYTTENCPAPHVLIIPGGYGTRALLQKPALLEWLRLKARDAEIVMSVCTGALVLGQAGLLDGLRVTTHHDAIELLQRTAPAAVVEPARRFTDNGRMLTAAGVAAGIDCSLHVVARLLGEDARVKTAAYLEYPISPYNP